MTPTMDLQPVTEYAQRFARHLALIYVNYPVDQPLSADNLRYNLYAAICARAETQPDFNASTDVSESLQAGIVAFYEALLLSTIPEDADPATVAELNRAIIDNLSEETITSLIANAQKEPHVLGDISYDAPA